MQWGEVVSSDDKGRRKIVSRTSMTLGARKYLQDILPEMIGNRNCGHLFSSVQSLSRVRLCDPMDCSTPGLSVHHQLLEPTHTHVHHVSDGKWAD